MSLSSRVQWRERSGSSKITSHRRNHLTLATFNSRCPTLEFRDLVHRPLRAAAEACGRATSCQRTRKCPFASAVCSGLGSMSHTRRPGLRRGPACTAVCAPTFPARVFPSLSVHRLLTLITRSVPLECEQCSTLHSKGDRPATPISSARFCLRLLSTLSASILLGAL